MERNQRYTEDDGLVPIIIFYSSYESMNLFDLAFWYPSPYHDLPSQTVNQQIRSK